MDEVLKVFRASSEWIEHHGVIVSILGLFIGGVGTRAWDKLENWRELTVERSAISVAGTDDIKVLVLEKPTVSLTIITVSIRNTGRKDLKEKFPVTIKTDKGRLLQCKMISASTGASCNLPEINAAEAHEVTFDVLPLRRGEHVQVQIYADEASRKDIVVTPRPIEVKVKILDFGEAKPGTNKLEQAAFLLLVFIVALAVLADRHPDAKDLAWFSIACIVIVVSFLYSLKKEVISGTPGSSSGSVFL